MSQAPKDVLLSSFLDSQDKIAGMELRPFSAGSYLIAQRRGLTLFTGEAQDLTAAEQLRQVMAFLYIQTAPMPEVLIAAGNEDRFNEAVDAFSLTVPMSAIPKTMEMIARLCAQSEAASVETVQKPGASTGETPPPNS